MTPACCSRCGADLSRDAPENLCPVCLLAALAMPVSGFTEATSGTHSPAVVGSWIGERAPRLIPGEMFGPYRIVRLIGRGGMGEVYEAEHVEYARRLALKILRQPLATIDDRARFMREGQLAASVNHPNSVYIFGSEEILDAPVIVMELLTGGTLKDRVRTHGPFGASLAVDTILQVIPGLEAALAVGVLHRDIKPNNCFTDGDGTVKVGDFGLSISTMARHPVILDGTFQGTPQFASPEQLRGDALDVRADIYSVGATLFYVLTGQAPFAVDDDLAALIDRIATQPPAWPLEHARSIPRDLVSVVERCLAKRPADRPAGYAELADQLAPFGSAGPRPATMGARFAAAAFDWTIAGGATLFVGLLLSVRLNGSPLVPFPIGWVLVMIAAVYYTLVGSVWSTTYGQRACDLEIATIDARRPGVRRVLARTSLVLTPLVLAVALHDRFGLALRSLPWPWTATATAFGGGVGVLFSTARTRNGYAGLHDLLSGTRVVERRHTDTLPPSIRPRDWSEATPTRHVGPYDVVAPLGATDVGELLLAVDPRLKRPAWIHVVPPHTAFVSTLARDLGRPGRLHWLNGQRTIDGAWDAYDAPAGDPLLAIPTPQPWHLARQWLLNLSREIREGLNDQSLDALAIDRVWLMPEGAAKLLEFRAPGAPTTATSTAPLTAASAQLFLRDVARQLMTGQALPLPLTASQFLDTLGRGGFATLDDLIATLERLATRPDRLTARRRGMALALSLVGAVGGGLALGRLLDSAFLPSVHAIALRYSLTPRSVGDVGCALLGVTWAIMWHGGFWLHVFDIAVVTRDGTEASRLRAACRALIAWSWVPAQIIAMVYGWGLFGLSVWVLKIAALSAAAEHPHGGWPDRLVGTYLVPR